MTFGEKLQRLRKAKGWTQEELAAQISISRQALSKWEQGTAIPDTENVLQISRIFGVSTDYLLHDEYESDADIPAVHSSTEKLTRTYESRTQTIIGSCVCCLGLIGVFVIAILGRYFPVHYVATAEGHEVNASGFGVFVAEHQLEWLVGLCVLAIAAGIVTALFPFIRKMIRIRKK